MEKRILGYIRVSSLTDDDYRDIVQGLDKESMIPPKGIEPLQWVYYAADSAVFNYYSRKEKQLRRQRNANPIIAGEEAEYAKRIKFKCMDLFAKMSGDGTFFRDKCKKKYKFPYSPEDEDILYDLIFVFEDILQDILSINLLDSRPHERLIFCYRYLVDGWGSKDILKKLRKGRLSELLMEFVNEYSMASGLPNAIVLFYFYPLEEDLYKSGSHDAKLNSYFSKIDIKGFINTIEKKSFYKELVAQRVNMIDKWCERTRERIINKITEY